MSSERTPSDIDIDEDSGRRRYDSHESLGYKRESGNSYSLPKSPTLPEPLDQSDPPSAIGEYPISSMAQMNDTSLASISRYPEGLDADPKTDTTRVLERAAEHAKLSSQQLAFTAVPPQRTSHTQYPEYALDLGDPTLSYTQVLIWCLQRRIDRIERNPPKDLTTSKLLELLRVLKTAQAQLIHGHITPRWNTYDLLRLKPRMVNPDNQRSAQIIESLDAFRKQLLERSRSSWKLLKQSETEIVPDNVAETQLGEFGNNKYNPVLAEARAENTKTIQSISQDLSKLDTLNALSQKIAMESVDRWNQTLPSLSGSSRKQ